MMKKLFLILSISGLMNFGLYSQNNNSNSLKTFNIKGFAGITWGSKYSDVLNNYKTLASDPTVKDPVDIVKEIPNKRLIIRRNNILYQFEFYETEFKDKNLHNTNSNNNKVLQKTPRFFFLESKFILVESNDLYKRLKSKYGKYTKNTVNKKTNRGAFIWDLPSGFIIQWIEPYEKQQFTRRIYYISKDIQRQIEKDLHQFRFSKEIQILKTINP